MFEVVAIDDDGRSAYIFGTFDSSGEEQAHKLAERWRAGPLPETLSWYDEPSPMAVLSPVGSKRYRQCKMVDVIVRKTGI